MEGFVCVAATEWARIDSEPSRLPAEVLLLLFHSCPCPPPDVCLEATSADVEAVPLLLSDEGLPLGALSQKMVLPASILGVFLRNNG